jgi:hypothetical protein
MFPQNIVRRGIIMSAICKNRLEACCYLSPHDRVSCLNQSACSHKVEGKRTGSEILEGFIRALNQIEREALTRYLEEKYDKD